MENKFRCHPSIILEKTSGIITVLLIVSMTSRDDINHILEEGYIAWVILSFIGLVFVMLIYNIIVWSKTYIYIEENTIIIQRNTINSKINTFGIKNIANVNLEQNIFERIVGTYKIKIDTDSLSTADKTDIEIVLSKNDAYNFKNNVLKLMNDKKNMQDTIESNDNIESYFEEDIEYDIVYSSKDILKHCFYNLSLGGIVFNLLIIAFTIFTLYQMEDVDDSFKLFMAVVASCIVIGRLFIRDLLRYYNFSIKRDKDKLFISYGLLKKNKFTIPINRINAINIKQSSMARIFKRYKSDIVTIGVGDDNLEGSQILLSSKKYEFILNMEKLMPEINIREELNLKKQPKEVHLIYIISIILLMCIFSLSLYVIHKVFIYLPIRLFICTSIFIFIFIFICICYYMLYLTKGINLGESNISMSWGLFSKNISIIKYKKIQHIQLKENPISNKFGLCKSNIFILASFINSFRSLGYYDKSLYEELKYKIVNTRANI